MDRQRIEETARLAIALSRFWERSGNARDGRRWLDTLLAHAADLPPRHVAALHLGAGNVAPAVRAIHHVKESLAIAREHGPPAFLAFAALRVGQSTADAEGFKAARPLLEEAVEAAREADSPRALSRALGMFGFFSVFAGEVTDGRALIAEAMEVALSANDDEAIRAAKFQTGYSDAVIGEARRARPLFEDALADYRGHHDRSYAVLVLFNLIWSTYVRLGDYDVAREALAELTAMISARAGCWEPHHPDGKRGDRSGRR